MIIFIEKTKNITLKGNKHLEIIAGKKLFVKPGGNRAIQATADLIRNEETVKLIK